MDRVFRPPALLESLNEALKRLGVDFDAGLSSCAS
jgi:hypothetical protein